MDKDSVTAHVACATVFYSLPGAFVIHNLQVDNGTQTEVAALYNMTDNTFVPFHIPESPFCSGHTLLPDGQGLVIGGGVSRKNCLYIRLLYIHLSCQYICHAQSMHQHTQQEQHCCCHNNVHSSIEGSSTMLMQLPVASTKQQLQCHSDIQRVN